MMFKNKFYKSFLTILIVGIIVGINNFIVMADDVSVTYSFNAGALTINVDNINFGSGAIAPQGSDLLNPTTYKLHIADLTGSGAGWHISMTSSLFRAVDGANNTHYLDGNAASLLTFANTNCSTGSSCIMPVNTINGVSVIPAANGNPSPINIFAAAAGSGMGAIDLYPQFSIHLPGYIYSGNYTATWTFSITSGP